MGAVFFYHLTRAPLESTLPGLVQKALAQGWRVAIRGRTESVIDRLDRALWEVEGFLPHGQAGGSFDARQPVLLTTTRALPNGAACVMAIEGAEVSPEEAAALSRVCILFDGGDAGAVEMARTQWRTLAASGLRTEYWSQEQGPWRRAAEAN